MAQSQPEGAEPHETKKQNLRRKPIRPRYEDPAKIVPGFEGLESDTERLDMLLDIIVTQNREMDQMQGNAASSMHDCHEAISDQAVRIRELTSQNAMLQATLSQVIDSLQMTKACFVKVELSPTSADFG